MSNELVLDADEFDENEFEEDTNPVWETVDGVIFYKEDENNRIWWVEDHERTGMLAFSFDQKKIFYLFQDYPGKLTPQQKEIFDRENPYWADFFRDRK